MRVRLRQYDQRSLGQSSARRNEDVQTLRLSADRDGSRAMKSAIVASLREKLEKLEQVKNPSARTADSIGKVRAAIALWEGKHAVD